MYGISAENSTIIIIIILYTLGIAIPRSYFVFLPYFIFSSRFFYLFLLILLLFSALNSGS